MPTATCTWASGSSCRPRTWRSRCVAHREVLRAHRAPRFRAAMTRCRKVTVIHKANVFRISMDFGCAKCARSRKSFPDSTQEVIVDAMAALLLRDPMRFDVIVAENMYGDILSDERPSSPAAWPRRLDQCRDEHLRRAGTARLGARHRGARTRPIPPRSSFPPRCCSNGWPRAAEKRRNGRRREEDRRSRGRDAENPATRTADLGGKIGTRQFAEAVTRKLG